MSYDRRTKTMLLVSILVLSFSLALSSRKQYWQGNSQWEGSSLPMEGMEVKDSQRTLEEYDCNVNTDGQCELDKANKDQVKMIETNEIPFKRRSNAGLPIVSFDKLIQMGGKSNVMPYFHTSQPIPCSCEPHYTLLDLGHVYHPRYLPTAVCHAAACGPGGAYRCRQRPYRVQVLRRRDAGPPADGVAAPSDLVNNPPLPESLRKQWVFETFTVTVACECAP